MQKNWAGHRSDQGCFRQPSIIQCTNQLLGDLLPHSLVKISHGLCLIASVASIMDVLSRQYLSAKLGDVSRASYLRCSACCNLC